MDWIDILTIIVAIGAAIIGGTFFAFSNFAMPALARQPAPAAIAAMNAINVTVLNPGFLGTFVGTALLSVVLIVAVLATNGSLWAVGGALLYLIGTFGVTVALNVPMNDQLAKVDPASAEGAAYWARYLKEWTSWNTVRAAAGIVATLCLVLAVMR